MLLRAEFVAAAQVVVYAGAVMVLYVFVVAYVGGGQEYQAGSALRILGPLFALAVAVELCIAMLARRSAGSADTVRRTCAASARPRDRTAVPDRLPVRLRGGFAALAWVVPWAPS